MKHMFLYIMIKFTIVLIILGVFLYVLNSVKYFFGEGVYIVTLFTLAILIFLCERIIKFKKRK